MSFRASAHSIVISLLHVVVWAPGALCGSVLGNSPFFVSKATSNGYESTLQAAHGVLPGLSVVGYFQVTAKETSVPSCSLGLSVRSKMGWP